MDLSSLAHKPHELLLELERRARLALEVGESEDATSDDWVGIAFRLGNENFVANRADVREVMTLPAALTRVPGAKPWLRGITNVRGQLMTIVDLRAFLGSGGTTDRKARVLALANREVPTGLIVDEVYGFRRFAARDFEADPPQTVLRCDRYLAGACRRHDEVFPRFDFGMLLEDETFLNAAAGS